MAAPGARIIASPLAKKLASEKGIDLSAVSGTGPHNRIIAADVKEYIPSGAFCPPPPTTVVTMAHTTVRT